jgi:hypothetical protein
MRLLFSVSGSERADTRGSSRARYRRPRTDPNWILLVLPPAAYSVYAGAVFCVGRASAALFAHAFRHFIRLMVRRFQASQCSAHVRRFQGTDSCSNAFRSLSITARIAWRAGSVSRLRRNNCHSRRSRPNTSARPPVVPSPQFPPAPGKCERVYLESRNLNGGRSGTFLGPRKLRPVPRLVPSSA